MLKDINNIDWKIISTPYGFAQDIPFLFETIIHNKGEVKTETIYELCGLIYHQGTLYEATIYALPFILELFDSMDNDENKKVIFAYIWAIYDSVCLEWEKIILEIIESHKILLSNYFKALSIEKQLYILEGVEKEETKFLDLIK